MDKLSEYLKSLSIRKNKTHKLSVIFTENDNGDITYNYLKIENLFKNRKLKG